MNIIVDTNVFISALIKSGVTREIIVNSTDNLLFPDFVFEEIKNHKKEIVKKSGLSEIELDVLILRLLNYIRIIPKEIILPFKENAIEIVKDIDVYDAPFIASALAFKGIIWSDDKKLKNQNSVAVFSTKEMLRKIN